MNPSALKRAKRPAGVIRHETVNSDGSVTVRSKRTDKYGVVRRTVSVVRPTSPR